MTPHRAMRETAVNQKELPMPDGLFMDLDRAGPMPLYFFFHT